MEGQYELFDNYDTDTINQVRKTNKLNPIDSSESDGWEELKVESRVEEYKQLLLDLIKPNRKKK